MIMKDGVLMINNLTIWQ